MRIYYLKDMSTNLKVGPPDIDNDIVLSDYFSFDELCKLIRGYSWRVIAGRWICVGPGWLLGGVLRGHGWRSTVGEDGQEDWQEYMCIIDMECCNKTPSVSASYLGCLMTTPSATVVCVLSHVVHCADVRIPHKETAYSERVWYLSDSAFVTNAAYVSTRLTVVYY